MKAPMLNEDHFATALAKISTMRRPAHYRLLLLLMRDLGLRPIELARLQGSWFAHGELHIPSGQTKRKKPRSLPLSAEIEQALALHMDGRRGTVFVNRDGDAFTPGTMGDSITRMWKQAGIRACCYSGRRTMASRLVDQGVNILVVQKVLGHSSPQTTLAYVEVTDGMMRRALFS